MRSEWISTSENTLCLRGFKAMHGGPRGKKLAAHQHMETQVAVHFAPGLRTAEDSELVPCAVNIIPPGVPHSGGWEDGKEVVVLLIPPFAVERAADEILVRSRFRIRGQNLAVDPLLQELCSSLRSQFRSSTGVSRIFVESAGSLAAEHILRNYAETVGMARPAGHLNDGELRQVTAFIDEHLEPGFTVAELADSVKMGIHRFARSLRIATGDSPYQSVQRRRVELAKQLLRGSQVDLAAIANRLGFASQSHFCNVFRKATGMTPQAYRLARR